LGHKTISITREAYELLSREKKGRESFSEMIKRLAKERGELEDSFGAWKMSDDEEERIFSSLNKNWKKWNNLTTADLAGSGRKNASVSEMKRLLDRMRAEDA
jgi:predicted CopG family antitoxin